MTTSERLLEEGRQLAGDAEELGLEARLLGGVAIRLLLGSRFDRTFERPYRDIDILVRRRDGARLEQLITERGWEPARQFNALNGARRLLFHDPLSEAQIDVFVDAFEMCHSLPLASALAQPGPSLPATELLMTKLQIVQLNAKDRDDSYALLRGCAPGQGDHTKIDTGQIARLTSRDWGLHHTFELNLSRLSGEVESNPVGEEGKQAISDAIAALTSAMESQPKSHGWRLRARIGERKVWYEEPEEVAR